MKIGLQTILWGFWIDDIELVLDQIQAAGFQGIEFAQRPQDIRVRDAETGLPRAVKIDELLAMLRKRDLHLVALASGALQQRVDFCGEFRPNYLYIEEWTPRCDELSQNEKPFTLAIHPHMYKGVHRLAQASKLLDAHPNLRFLPDTAHFKIAGDCPVEAIQKWWSRLAAVHLKDWTPNSGYSSFHYAKGFVPLGDGDVELDACLRAIRNIEVERALNDVWIIVEQDNPGRYGIQESLRRSTSWLKSHGVRMRDSRVSPTSESQSISVEGSDTAFQARMLQAASDSDNCHQIIAEAFHNLIPSYFVNVWKYSPAHDLLCVAGVAGQDVKLNKTTMRGKGSLSGDTIEQMYVRHFVLTDPDVRERFADHGLFDQVDGELHTMISIPIPNLWNKNHLWLLINVFPKQPECNISPDALMRYYTGPVAIAIRSAVEERCFRAMTRTSYLAAQPLDRISKKSADDFLRVLCRMLQEVLGCQAVHAFLVNNNTDRLEHRAATGDIEWCDNDRRYYVKGLGLTGKVWAEKEAILSYDLNEADRHSHSTDIVSEPNRREALLAPITRLGAREVIGVIRCRNRNQPTNKQAASMFSDEDVAVVESVIYAAAPHVELLKANDARLDMLRKLVHELGKPIVAVKGAVYEIAEDPNLVRSIRHAFPHDYLDDIKSWIDLISRLLSKVSANEQVWSGLLELRPERITLAPDVVAPAARRLTATLRERGFQPGNVRRGSWSIPPLYLDRNMMQEVVLNLLDNAVKYAYKDPHSFRVEIDAQETPSAFELYFRDYGPGIPKELQEKIFEEGFRGVDAEGVESINAHVFGQGLGLWFVRDIVEAHGGRVYVSQLRYPTEFTISLPKRLLSSKP